jgi:alpha-mannosidase
VPFEYCTSGESLPGHIERCSAELQDGGTALMCFFGVGNHGGGPTRANIETIDRLAGESTVELHFSSPPQFFQEVDGESALPVVREELQHHASGCYAAHSAVKQWNRQSENRLLIAEKFSTIAQRVAGQPYPMKIQDAWKNVLLNQFHDILAGTSLEVAYEDARDSYGEARNIAARALHQALQAIAWKIDIPYADGSTPIVVFNPHGWPSRMNVELETDGLQRAESLTDEHGRAVPLQTVRSQAVVGNWRRRISFNADLPPLGYRVFRGSARPSAAVVPPSQANAMENESWRLRADAESGSIVSLFDKRRHCEVLARPGGRAVVMADPSDTWGHKVLRFQQEIGAFAAKSIKVIEHGPVKSVLRVESRYGASTLVQEFALINGLDTIIVNVTVDWHEQQQLLKLRWPVAVRMPKATYEIAYGTIERPPSGDEEPGQSWFDVTGIHERTGESYGMSILNDAKYSFDVRGSEMSLTVLRSPAFAHHDPFKLESAEGVTFIDQGVQRFQYALLPHPDGWVAAQAARRAAELNQPAIAMLDTFHDGPLPAASAFAEAIPEALAITALKLAEDGSGDVIVRCFETSGQPTLGRICLPFINQVIEAAFRPHEIKTFRVGASAQEVNLLECSI